MSAVDDKNKTRMDEERTADPGRNLKTVKTNPVVLLVDDDHAAVTVTAATLQRLGCRTLLAGNGEKALRILESQSCIDIVVTDVAMPGVDGLELLQEIKRSARHKELPVIMCSGQADPETKKRAIDSGCALYILKPIEPEFLLEEIITVLKGLT